MQEVKQLQRNPELGEWRIQAALKLLGIHLSLRTCGRILALHRSLYGLKMPQRELHEPRPHPFRAEYRHHIWSVDLRYIEKHRLGDPKPVYIISILDNFSRAILASGISRTQNLTDYLIVLFAAIRQHGAPTMLVSDNGSIFKAKQAQKIYASLGIQKEHIQKRQAWQNLIESQFNLMRRLADWDAGSRCYLDSDPCHSRQMGCRPQLPATLRAQRSSGSSAFSSRSLGVGSWKGPHLRGIAPHFLRKPASPKAQHSRVSQVQALASLWRIWVSEAPGGHLAV